MSLKITLGGCAYSTLCLIRVILVLLPQIGYIHPDEHFQGPEVIYGDLLQLKVYTPWEFTTEYPLRNIVFPYIITGLPSLLFKAFNIKEWCGLSYPYLLLVMPRLLMCGLSFLHDLLLYKVCVLMKKDYKIHLILFASSYVTLIFLTRTFSNSLESLFFSLMIYMLCKFLNYKNMLSDTSKNLSNTQPFMNLSFMFGLVTAMGVFNRPTFLCYCIFPVLSYAFLLITSNIKKRQIMNNLVSFGLGGLSILISFTAIDTLYYNRTHYSSKNSDNKIIFTPLNFILFNTDNDNLHKYGLHTRWLHSMINIPLLFSTIGILMNFKSFVCLYNFIKVPCLNYKNLMFLVYIIPLFLLSLIPHQEPRFVIPLLFPMVLLCKEVTQKCNFKKTVVTTWLFQNILAVIFFGFFHQGGVYTSSSFIYSQIQDNTSYSMVFYKTYMPPRYLLGVDQAREDIEIYDFGGVDNNTLENLLQEKKLLLQPQFMSIVVPQELESEVFNLPSIVSDYKLVKKKSIFPHLSTETMPNYLDVISRILKPAPNETKIFPNSTQNLVVLNSTDINSSLTDALSISVLIFKSNHQQSIKTTENKNILKLLQRTKRQLQNGTHSSQVNNRQQKNVTHYFNVSNFG